MKYIIEHNYNKCKDCEFMDYSILNHNICQIDGKPVNQDSECHLKPLKVKELEWDNTNIAEINKDGAFIYEISKTEYGYNLAYAGDLKFLKLFKTIDEAKQACQNHYNNLIMSGLEEKC